MQMKIFKLILGFLLVGAVGLIGLSYWFYRELNTPVAHGGSDRFIKIEKGTAPNAIIDELSREGVIGSPLAAKIYLRLFGDASKLQAGEYQFPSPITPLGVLKELENGEARTIKLTIPEGFSRFDIAKRIADRFSRTEQVDERQVLLLMEDTSLIKDIAPEAKNLEGYMYPSTYNLPLDAKPADVIKVMVEQFRKSWKPEWTEAAKARGRSVHELVTIASLIETESKFDAERKQVASVIYNRLEKRIPLGIDQTVVYIAKMEDRWDGTIHKSDLEADSPYNTRRFGGLPPGPISSVTVSSIEAALAPAETNYLFYVLNVRANDGSHHFYATAAEFEKGKAEYQVWLEEQRRLKREAEAAASPE